MSPNDPRYHGKSHTLTYKSWEMMRDRCLNPNGDSWHNYGGRGIKICARWNRFLNFLEDMGERPSMDYSIDRIDNDGNYEPENCKWSTKLEQAANTRFAHSIEGLPAERIARQVGLSPMTVVRRTKLGQSIHAPQDEYLKGEHHSKAILTNEKVLAIRAECGVEATSDQISQTAQKFGLKWGHVYKLSRRLIWKHL